MTLSRVAFLAVALAALLAVPAQAQAPAADAARGEKRVALVIGNGAYMLRRTD